MSLAHLLAKPKYLGYNFKPQHAVFLLDSEDLLFVDRRGVQAVSAKKKCLCHLDL